MEPARPKAAGKDVGAWGGHLRQDPVVAVSVPVADTKPDMSQGSHAIKYAVPNVVQL